MMEAVLAASIKLEKITNITKTAKCTTNSWMRIYPHSFGSLVQNFLVIQVLNPTAFFSEEGGRISNVKIV